MNHVMSFMVTHQCTLVFLFTIINSKHDYERKNLKSRSALQETNSCHFLSMVTHQCTLVFLFTIINSKHDSGRKNLKSRSALQETNSCHFLSMFTHQCTLVFLFTIIKHNKHDSGRKNLNQGQLFKLISEKREWLPARLSQFFAH